MSSRIFRIRCTSSRVVVKLWMQRMSSRIRRNILIFTIWYIRIRFSEITTRLRRIFRWGKIDRRKQLLLPSAPNFLYKEALSEPYNSAKFPEKPSGARAFRPDGVKNVPTRIVSNPSRDGGAPGGIWTHGLSSRSRTLYPRSYGCKLFGLLYYSTSYRFLQGIYADWTAKILEQTRKKGALWLNSFHNQGK